MICNAAFKIFENKVILESIASRLNSISGRVIGKAMAAKMTPKPWTKSH